MTRDHDPNQPESLFVTVDTDLDDERGQRVEAAAIELASAHDAHGVHRLRLEWRGITWTIDVLREPAEDCGQCRETAAEEIRRITGETFEA